MYEKAPEHIEVSFPVKFGVIADIENMQTLLLRFFNKMNDDKKFTGNTDFYIAVPTDVTEVEKRAFYELVADSKVKAKNIYIVDKPGCRCHRCRIRRYQIKGYHDCQHRC